MEILALSDLHGRTEMLRRVHDVASGDFEAVVFTGDIVVGKARGDEWLEAKAAGRAPDPDKEAISLEGEGDRSLYEEFFQIVGEWNVPLFYVPGNMDAPRQRYFESVLRGSKVAGRARCVHGAPALFHDFVLCGVGGEITEGGREDFFVLQTPGWEVEHLLSFLPDFHDRRAILLFHSPPVGELDVDKGQHKGSGVVNEILERYQPWLVFCGHAHNSRGRERMGDTVAVNPGALKAGYYAFVDTETREVELGHLG